MPLETYRMEIKAICSGEQAANVLHFICDNNDDGQPRSIAAELVTKWVSTHLVLWRDIMSEHYAIRYIECKRILPGGGNSYWREFPEGSETGNIIGVQAPLHIAPIMKLFTGLATGTQGRVFLPAPAASQIIANALDSDYRDDAIECFQEMLSFSGTTHDFWLAVYSKKNNNSGAVTTCTISDIIGMQGRRRQPL